MQKFKKIQDIKKSDENFVGKKFQNLSIDATGNEARNWLDK